MSLADKLAATRAASASRIPPEKAAIMHRATDELRRSGALDRIVKAGRSAPAFVLRNYDGNQVQSTGLLARGPLVLSFFRGSW